jgi:very-short-patch-repair endonuclease
VRRPKYSLDAKRNFAAAMRAQPTKAEAAMWEYLRADATGFRFRRQITIQGYIVDFWCPTLRIAIEVDGSVHLNPEIAAKDAEKERVMEARGIRLLRFDNEDVLHFRLPVFMRIKTECDQRACLKGLVRGVAGAVPNPSRSNRSHTVKVDESENYKRISGMSSRGLCTTDQDCVQIPGNRLITPEEYESFQRKLITISRQRSMTLGLPPDNRSTAERAADLRYRLAEHLERKRRQA